MYKAVFSKGVVLFLTMVAWIIFPIANGWAWEVKTHKEITEQAIKIVEADLNDYLINNLGLENGLNASVTGGTPQKLMELGSRKEDDSGRFVRHFHEPLFNVGLLGFDSAINWALRAIGGQGEEAYSWNDAREYYFKAVTSETKDDRNKYWSETFRALGQVMHLLQDSANPSHVRNDPHPVDDGLHDFMNGKSVSSYIGGGIFSPDSSMLEQSGPAGPNGEPFSNLFDRNMYSGLNPEATLGTNIGITEYTNANFFSDDRIPGQSFFFPPYIYPSLAELIPAPVPSPYLTLPRLGPPDLPAARAAKLTSNQAAAQFLLTNTHFHLIGKLQLDDAVYDAQAQTLIPRAVGYSVAVLDYFLRGELEVTHQVFEVESSALGNNTTECTQTPLEEFGFLNVQFTIPSTLNYSGDTPSEYYEQSDKTRLLAGATVPLAGIADPVRWYVVLDGPAGPGTQESRAILAKTGVAPWEFFCDT